MLTVQNTFCDFEHELLELPTCLGIIIPSCQTTYHYSTSNAVPAPVVALILQQSHQYPLEAKAGQIAAISDAYK